jgi:hypothetical protein
MNKLNLACLHTLISHLSADDSKTFHEQYLSNFWKINYRNDFYIVHAQNLNDIIMTLSQSIRFQNELRYLNGNIVLTNGSGYCYLCDCYCDKHETKKTLEPDEWFRLIHNMIIFNEITCEKIDNGNIII